MVPCAGLPAIGIIHAGGDATGAEIQRVVQLAVSRDPAITLITHALALDLLTDTAGHAVGVTVHVAGTAAGAGVGAVPARATVLATGGTGQVYDSTSTPPVATGDGPALALRAGAAVTDLEFVQFHPTVLALDGTDPRQSPEAPFDQRHPAIPALWSVAALRERLNWWQGLALSAAAAIVLLALA